MNALNTVENAEIPPKNSPEHVPNAVTLAAMREADAIARGEIPSAIVIDSTQYRTRGELKTNLKQALQS
jgi:hypothetical protein